MLFNSIDWRCNVTFLQEEKKELRAKAEEEQRLKEKASISIPLLSEHPDDVERAQKMSFASGSSGEDRKRKRLEIKSQSVFGSSVGTHKKARVTLLKACSATDGGIFNKRTNNPAGKALGGSKKKQIRKSLGIRTEQGSPSS